MKLSRYVAIVQRFLLCAESLGFWVAIKVIVGARLFRIPVTVRLKKYNAWFSIRGGACDLGSFANFYNGFPYVRSSRIKSILDGGANIGDSSVLMAVIYKPELLVAVEPDPDNFRMLVKNASFFPEIKAVEAALWTSDTQLSLFGHESSTVSSVVKEQESGGVSVKARSIASLALEYGVEGFDLVKLDIEGAERELLAHDRGAWVRHCTVFIIELHDHMAPGAGEALINAVQQWGPFRLRLAGEYLVFIRVIKDEEISLSVSA